MQKSNLKHKTKLFIVCGPTAIGKSRVAVELAKVCNAEIIGADALQIYRGLDIGTGKITPEETCGIAHHMIDIVNPDDTYSVDSYIRDVRKAIASIARLGKNCILVGGTGFYINALTQGFNLAEVAPDLTLRKKYQALADEKGGVHLHKLLTALDPQSAQKISNNDIKRIIRALEIVELTGSTKSERVNVVEESDFDVLQVVLTAERSVLYNRINARVDQMFDNGLEQEVRGLATYRNNQSMQAIGYKELLGYFDGDMSLEMAVDKIKQHSRNYAKRQMTYFRWMKVENKIFMDVEEVNFLENIKKLTLDFFCK